MHASHAFVNGAGNSNEDLRLLNTLLSTGSSEPRGPHFDQGKPKDERQAEERQVEEQSKPGTASRPGGFKNDPDDPANPNEVRERHLKKIKR